MQNFSRLVEGNSGAKWRWVLTVVIIHSLASVTYLHSSCVKVAYISTKKRSEFGRHCKFSDGETLILESILPTDAFDDQYCQKTVMLKGIDTTPHLAETAINTERVVMKSTSMLHQEGGWPKVCCVD